MSIQRPGLEQIDGSGATRGQVPVWNPDTQVWGPGASGVQTASQGNGTVIIDNTDPANPIFSTMVVLTTEIGGVPDLVWDSDNQLVYTEAR